jgi:WD40 repeat protein
MDEPERGARDDTGTDALDGPPREADVQSDISKGTKRAWLFGAGAFLVVALIVGAVFLLGDDGDESGEDGTAAVETTSSDEADPSDVPTSSYQDPSDLDGQEDTDGSPGDADGDGVSPPGDDVPVDAGMVAYRLGAAIWVAGGDGSDPRKVVDASPADAYALSPDGTALALVRTGTLRIVEVDSGSYAEVGPAATDCLVWSPDSEWLAYQDDRSGALALADRTGSKVRELTAGSQPDFDRTGDAMIYVPDPSSGPSGPRLAIASTEGGEIAYLTVPLPLADATWDGDVLCYALQAAPGPGSEIRRATVAGPDDEDASGSRLVSAPHGVGFTVGYTGLALSPDGKMLAYAASGDDGFSRLYVVPVAGGTPKELSIRRDAYPLRWSADGAYILFIEGNQWHGEDTRLMRVRPDGMGREVLVDGAGL